MEENKIYNFISAEDDYANIKSLDELLLLKRKLKSDIENSKSSLTSSYANTKAKFYLDTIKPGYDILSSFSKKIRYISLVFSVIKRVKRLLKKK